MTLKVIGAGFGRTGTDSLREALNILGFGRCHHMHEVMESGVQTALWLQKAEGAPVTWEALFEGFNSCVDWPASAFWPELMTHYPDAKIILTDRDPESWWSSYSKTILPAFERLAMENPRRMSFQIVAQGVLGGRFADKDHVLAAYAKNTDDVLATVPAERLLVMKLGSGWTDLCPFLGVPEPDAPYPRTNSTADFRAKLGSNAPGASD